MALCFTAYIVAFILGGSFFVISFHSSNYITLHSLVKVLPIAVGRHKRYPVLSTLKMERLIAIEFCSPNRRVTGCTIPLPCVIAMLPIHICIGFRRCLSLCWCLCLPIYLRELQWGGLIRDD